ncbi:MAG: DUF262 domain-containing HNH endonuclease family protein [Spirochaetes bacterium]|nr:DUF262 domain-containing HNH endonuclease family protein [Spirochaetota bacterium]
MSKLHVDQKSIESLLSDKSNQYLIPEYQRPYEWDEERCRTLWDDILEFAMPENDANDFKEEYFLGSIVTFKNNEVKNNEVKNNEEFLEVKNNEEFLEVIDGQQRITTLLLLLRAIYKKLEPSKDDKSIGVKRQIGQCIWHTDKFTKEPNKDKIKIDTKVATDKDREALISILKTGTTTNGKDIYSQNYRHFTEWIDEYVKDYPIPFYNLCIRILNNCILLPIECESQDVALRIFTTLNDRGMPLSDSDIFKAQLYKYYSNDNKQDSFIQKWQKFSEICDDIPKNNKSNQNTTDEIFTQYMYWLRAKDNIKDTTVPGLRKYFEQNKYEKLKNDEVMKDVISLSNFWKVLSDKDANNDFEVSEEALKYVHALEHMPNAFWKYNFTVYFFANKSKEDKLEEKGFEEFTKKTLAYCFVSYITRPGVSYIKNASIPAFVDIANKRQFKYPIFAKEDFKREFHNIYAHSKFMIKPVLLWEAYQIPEQTLIDRNGNNRKIKIEIEHILPKNWKSANYKNWNRKEADEYLEKLGNKIILDKKTNIQAGDGFFKTKKDRWYKKSPIKIVNKLAKEYPHDDWIKADIEKREDKLLNDFLNFAIQYGIVKN